MKKRHIFNSHLHDVEESYFVHMRHSFGFAYRLFSAGVILFIHGLFPFLFKQYGSNQVFKVVQKLKAGKRGETFNQKIEETIFD